MKYEDENVRGILGMVKTTSIDITGVRKGILYIDSKHFKLYS